MVPAERRGHPRLGKARGRRLNDGLARAPPYDAEMPPHPDAALRLEPFHGVRYAPALDLAAVTAPPYDVLDDEAVAALDASDPHNVVRLVLPRGCRPRGP